MATGNLILYTSADSVLQIAAHEEVVPLPELYRICEAARQIADSHRIGARHRAAVRGRSPATFKRTYNRRDFSLVPPAPTLLDAIARRRPAGGGHRQDLGHLRRPRRRPARAQRRKPGRPAPDAGGAGDAGPRPAVRQPGRLRHGLRPPQRHRRAIARALRARRLPAAAGSALRPARRWCSSPPITATIRPTPGTDHTREHVPLLAFGPAVRRAPTWARARRSRPRRRRSPKGFGRRRAPRGDSFLAGCTPRHEAGAARSDR